MKPLPSQKGFTLLETLISVALIGMLLTVLMSVENLVNKEKNKMMSRLDSSIDTLVGERTLYLDFRGLSPSFNLLKVGDDRGGNLHFFDYYFDVPEGLITPNPKDRQFTLEPGKNIFYILHQDPEAGALLNFDPVAAYDVGATPVNFNEAARLTYISVNKNRWISSQRPHFWQQDKLLLFDTNVYLRRSNPVDMTEAPVSPAFLGEVKIQNNQIVGPDLSQYLKTTYRTADAFLRDLPSRGGGQPFVKVRSVRLYRYYLQAYTDHRVVGSPSRLIRDEYINGKFDRPHMISDRVRVVKFSRESVMSKVVRFSIEKLADKNAQ